MLDPVNPTTRLYMLSFKQAVDLGAVLIAPPLFAGRLYDQKGLFLDVETRPQPLDPRTILRIRFPVDKCVELPGVEGRPYDPLEPEPFLNLLLTRILYYIGNLNQRHGEVLMSAPDDRIVMRKRLSTTAYRASDTYKLSSP